MKANKLKELIQNLKDGNYKLTNEQILKDELSRLDDDIIKWVVSHTIDKLIFVRKAHDNDYIMLRYEIYKKDCYGCITVLTNENVSFITVNYTYMIL